MTKDQSDRITNLNRLYIEWLSPWKLWEGYEMRVGDDDWNALVVHHRQGDIFFGLPVRRMSGMIDAEIVPGPSAG